MEHVVDEATPHLSGVSDTLLIPIYVRAMESRRPDALMRDDRAEMLVSRLGRDFERVKAIRLTEVHKAMRILLTCRMDRYARDFLGRHPDAVVVHIGCGLDTRFERVDNGRVTWFDLDLPDVIALRRGLIGVESGRHHLLGCSILESTCLEAVQACAPRPCLFLAEAVLVYFSEAQVKALVLRLRDHFPGSELVFDGWTPLDVWVGNRWLSSTRFAGLLRWGIWRGRDVERWGDGIRLLDDWGFFDQPEPRLRSLSRVAPIFRWLRVLRCYHFGLG